MIRTMHSLLRHVRMMIVAALALMTICSGLAAAHADVITVNHIAQGERMLSDGGWTAACDTAIERCAPPPAHADTDSYGLHHHHHPDCPFSGLPVATGAVPACVHSALAVFATYAAAVKPAAPSAADQPPKI